MPLTLAAPSSVFFPQLQRKGNPRRLRYLYVLRFSRFRRCPPLSAGSAASVDVSKIAADIHNRWPEWSRNACRRLAQGQPGAEVHGPTPAQAAAMLHGIAKVSGYLPGPSRRNMTREREVKGLVEALQVTPPRPPSSDFLGLHSSQASYPSTSALESLTAGDASQCIWALAALGGGAVYAAETDGLLQVGQAHGWQLLTPNQQTNVCWGLATSRHCTPAMGHIMDKGLHLTALAKLKPKQVTNLLWSCAVLLHHPDVVVKDLATIWGPTEAIPGMSKWTSRHLAKCAWALSVLQQQSSDLFWLFWAEINRRPKTSFNKEYVLMQIHQVVIEAASAGIDVAAHDKQGLLEAARLAWQASVSHKASKHTSYCARDIVNTVIGLGLQYIEEDTSTGYAIDVSLPQLKIAIEADGPTHRCRNTGQPLGGTVMKQRHVQAAGWQLVTVTHDDWQKLQGRPQKLQYLQARLDQFK